MFHTPFDAEFNALSEKIIRKIKGSPKKFCFFICKTIIYSEYKVTIIIKKKIIDLVLSCLTALWQVTYSFLPPSDLVMLPLTDFHYKSVPNLSFSHVERMLRYEDHYYLFEMIIFSTNKRILSSHLLKSHSL